MSLHRWGHLGLTEFHVDTCVLGATETHSRPVPSFLVVTEAWPCGIKLPERQHGLQWMAVVVGAPSSSIPTVPTIPTVHTVPTIHNHTVPTNHTAPTVHTVHVVHAVSTVHAVPLSPPFSRGNTSRGAGSTDGWLRLSWGWPRLTGGLCHPIWDFG